MTETILTPAEPTAAEAAEADSCAPGPAHAIGTEIAGTLAVTLKALAEPLRLRMLSAIATDPRGESCVCDLADLAEVSQPTISHHLKVLRTVGLLESERRGTWVWYRIPAERRAAVTALLEAFAPALTTSGPTGSASAASALGTAGGTGTGRLELTDFAELADMDEHITRLAEDLAAKTPALPAETVTGIVRDSYTALARSATITRHLVPLTERFARQRLADLTRDRATAPPQVLFVCVANAGRSQLAAALTREISGGRIVARSAGSAPAAGVHPRVRDLITEINGSPADAEEAFPKPLTDDAIRAADVVITMGCGDVCPVIRGIRYEDWAVSDPALASADGVLAIRDDIAARVRTLIDSLPAD
ncbi:ArsR family transcriptional regulator [Brevibacterium sanguinis]|uniref:ArsR family transcriptional regulator n=2 Tax=Brevibacterium TaxID=1696 RepID=A0A366IQ90_9MICO|nr:MULTISPECIES: metalloregulator ArsR/SmtB family transcription factor [Brevibacterium]RBP61732.1 ArsR family transcriptional regulator [Brevibacterium sanguinis]RBP74287.1 ArsR family transcriptional regulator [Brevibacterium celere]